MKHRNLILRLLLWLGIGVLIALYIINPTKSVEAPQKQELFRMLILRIAAIPVLLCCAALLRLRLFTKPKVGHLLFLLPALLVACNNFPWLALASGSAKLERIELLGWLILQVLAVGVMEELAFRGILLPLLLERLGKTKKGMWLSILLSSAIFGLIHFANLIETPNLSATLMQVGYSALLGALCAILLLGTGNLWYCVAVHTIYNFGGGVTAYLIQGKVWNFPTILCTVLVAVFVGIWYFYRTLRINPAALPAFFQKEKREKDGQNNG